MSSRIANFCHLDFSTHLCKPQPFTCSSLLKQFPFLDILVPCPLVSFKSTKIAIGLFESNWQGLLKFILCHIESIAFRLGPALYYKFIIYNFIKEQPWPEVLHLEYVPRQNDSTSCLYKETRTAFQYTVGDKLLIYFMTVSNDTWE